MFMIGSCQSNVDTLKRFVTQYSRVLYQRVRMRWHKMRCEETDMKQMYIFKVCCLYFDDDEPGAFGMSPVVL